MTRFLKNKLKLSVNLDKSAATSVIKRSFLGFTLLHDGKVAISKESIKRFKDKIRLITKRNRGVKIETVIRELNQATRGWFHFLSVPTLVNLLSYLIVGLEDGFDVTELSSVRENILSKLSLKGYCLLSWQLVEEISILPCTPGS